MRLQPPPQRFDIEHERQRNRELEASDRENVKRNRSTTFPDGVFLSAEFRDRGGAVHNVLSAGLKRDGTLEDQDRLQNWYDDLPTGARVLYPAGTYLHPNVEVEGKSLDIMMDGATLVQAADEPIFSLRGGWDIIHDLSAIAASTYDFSNGATVTTQVSKLTVDGTLSGIAAGDVVKVVSDDQLTAATTTTRRRGEFAVVGAIDGNDIYLTGLLRDTYTTNPRVGKLADVSFSLVGGALDTSDSGDAADWTEALVIISAARDVVVDRVRVVRGWGQAIKLQGVCGWSVSQMRASNLTNSPSASRFGYGLIASGSEHGTLNNSIFTNCRHGFTTDASTSDADSDLLERYGRTAHVKVAHSHGLGCSNSAFDCHNDAYDISFDHCSSVSEVRGEGSTGAGFQVRGKRIRLNHCRTRGGRVGVAIYDDGGGATDDVVIHEMDVEGATVTALFADALSGGTRVTGVTVDGGRWRSDGFWGMQLQEADVTLRNGATVSLHGAVANSRGFDLTDSTITIDDAKLDLTAYTGTDGYAFFSRDADCAVSGKTFRVEVDSADFDTFMRGAGSNDGTLDLVGITYDVEPATFDVNLTSAAFSTRVDGSNSSASSFRAQNLTADGTDLDIEGVADDEIYIRLLPDANRTLGNFPAGYKRGQILHVRQWNAGGFTVTVPTGTSPYRTDLGANQVLDVRDAMTLVWGGSDWILVNRYVHP